MWPFKGKQASSTAATAIGNFQIQRALPNGGMMNFSMYALEGEDAASLNRKADICQEVMERQRVRCEIPELEAKREQMIKGMEQARAVLADLEERQKSGSNLSSQERMNMKNMSINIAKVNEEIKKGEESIIEAKRKAGVG